MFCQTGRTEGNIIAIYCPYTEFTVPDTDDGDGQPTWPFKGMALESADDANDDVLLAIL